MKITRKLFLKNKRTGEIKVFPAGTDWPMGWELISQRPKNAVVNMADVDIARREIIKEMVGPRMAARWAVRY